MRSVPILPIDFLSLSLGFQPQNLTTARVDLHVVRLVCDRVIVMRRGEKRADKPIHQTSPEEVTALITGAKEAA